MADKPLEWKALADEIDRLVSAGRRSGVIHSPHEAQPHEAEPSPRPSPPGGSVPDGLTRIGEARGGEVARLIALGRSSGVIR